jgi:hypothetical protein
MPTATLSAPIAAVAPRTVARPVPFLLAARELNRPRPLSSLRVPVTPANRSYLRRLRHAELRAWQRTDPPARPARESAADLHREQRDLYSFGLIVALTLTLAGVVLAQSSAVTQQCAHMVSFVRQLLG